jgi:hypothetical protein
VFGDVRPLLPGVDSVLVRSPGSRGPVEVGSGELVRPGACWRVVWDGGRGVRGTGLRGGGLVIGTYREREDV